MALSACSYSQTAKDAWKFSKRQYYSHINTPASLDLDDTGSSEACQLALSEHIMDADRKVATFIRRMENSDINPDQRWVMNMVNDFPWLSGIAIIDNTGNIVAGYPEFQMKPLEFDPLLEEDPKQHLLDLRAYMQQSPLGPEVYVGKPLSRDGDIFGMVVGHFDPRALLRSSAGDIDKIAMYCPTGEMWLGDQAGGGLSGVDWQEVLLNRTSGYHSTYYWTSRYVGNMPVVYAIPKDSTPDHVKSEENKGMTATAPVPRKDIPEIPEEDRI